MLRLILFVTLLLSPTLVSADTTPQRLHEPDKPWVCDAQQWARIQDPTQREALYKESDRLAYKEWHHNARLRRTVGTHKGQSHYRKLRRLYLHRGLCDPATMILKGLVMRKLMGRWVLLHHGADAAITRALTKLGDTKVRKPGEVGGFQARTIRGPFQKTDILSNHAFGLALDLGAKNNPFLSPEELTLLEEISQTKLLLSVDTPAGERWDSFDAAVKGLRAKLPTWLETNYARIHALKKSLRKQENPEQIQELATLERKRSLSRKRHLRMLRDRRGFNLSRALVVALEEEGMIWCTDFATGADLMHFELRSLWRHAED